MVINLETAIVNFKDVAYKNKNPTLCISAARYTGNCVNCRQFKMAQYKIEKVLRSNQERFDDRPWNKYKFKKTRLPIDEALKSLKCKPFVSEEELKLLHKRDKLFDKKDSLQKEINDINEMLDMPLKKMEREMERKKE